MLIATANMPISVRMLWRSGGSATASSPDDFASTLMRYMNVPVDAWSWNSWESRWQWLNRSLRKSSETLWSRLVFTYSPARPKSWPPSVMPNPAMTANTMTLPVPRPKTACANPGMLPDLVNPLTRNASGHGSSSATPADTSITTNDQTARARWRPTYGKTTARYFQYSRFTGPPPTA